MRKQPKSPTLAKSMNTPYLAKCGGTYSSEWFWSKILHCKRTAPDVYEAAYSWTECVDFVPGFITGTLKPDILQAQRLRSRSQSDVPRDWADFLRRILEQTRTRIRRSPIRLFSHADAADQKAGELDRRNRRSPQTASQDSSRCRSLRCSYGCRRSGRSTRRARQDHRNVNLRYFGRCIWRSRHPRSLRHRPGFRSAWFPRS